MFDGINLSVVTRSSRLLLGATLSDLAELLSTGTRWVPDINYGKVCKLQMYLVGCATDMVADGFIRCDIQLVGE